MSPRAWRLLDLFAGEGGAAMGYSRAGWEVFGVDNTRARLSHYPFPSHLGDALQFALDHGVEFDAIHASPPCTAYSRATVSLDDRMVRYDRLIGVTRDVLQVVGVPYVIENVADARPELEEPIMLCGRMFGRTAIDSDGVQLVLDRHRLFESNVPLYAPPHLPHDRSLQVAGSYDGARRDKRLAREVRQGGYVPSGDVQRALLGVPWMTIKGCWQAVPPDYTHLLGLQLLAEVVTR